MDRRVGAFPHGLISELEQAVKRAAKLGEVPIVAGCVDPQTETWVVASNEIQCRRSGLAHAECLALKAMQKQLNTRYLTDVMMISTLEPCTMCMGAMAQCRIAGLLFGGADPKAGYFSTHEIVINPQTPQPIRIGLHTLWVRHVDDSAIGWGHDLALFFRQRR